MNIFSRLFGRLKNRKQAASAADANEKKGGTDSPARPSAVLYDLRHTISKLNDRAPKPEMAQREVLAPIFPITEARKKAEVRAKQSLRPGQLIPGKGVFLGEWSPKDRKGRSLKKNYNLYAAPHDLGFDENGQGSRLATGLSDAVQAVGKITDLMGHSGAKYKNDAQLYKALRSDAYKGEWFIPPRDVVYGTDLVGHKQLDNLYQHRDKGKFVNSFAAASGSELPLWYWTCSERLDFMGCYWVVDFNDGSADQIPDGNLALTTRLVRAELQP